MLEILNLKVSYGAIKALDGVSLRVDRGEIAALLGANGSGKTTALRAVTGQAAIQEGRILFAGREIQGLPPHEIIRRGLAVVPEGRRIFANLTVAENLLMGAYWRREKDAARDMKEIFKTFPRLAERRGQRAGTLSGGEQQMLALGRALMSRPRLLLLDEPSLGLAPLLVREVFHIIKKLHEREVTILLVEQNAAAALEIAHYGYVLETGRIVLEGKGNDLLEHPRLKDAYLGE
ncbi:MAG: ABC transporter ATP-binding protein [Deltaproteobacteria bacterium]|nr:ABC transporter ATP-binding protein [Deltaproteobacteria bacterium]